MTNELITGLMALSCGVVASAISFTIGRVYEAGRARRHYEQQNESLRRECAETNNSFLRATHERNHERYRQGIRNSSSAYGIRETRQIVDPGVGLRH